MIRTAGNLVPAYAPGGDGIAASIEYAVAVLGVSRVVVCGHSGCGAMTAVAERHDLSAMPTIAQWLRHADAGAARVGAAAADPCRRSCAPMSLRSCRIWPPTRPFPARRRRRRV
ncbi:carbonic anhydrase [Nocardia sp. NPDC058497]|uniref:carbonic anhydrase n=1 Tax=Nocardia sp. NPDC058497 TaxID=3346529 RepID=UPI00364F48A9